MSVLTYSGLHHVLVIVYASDVVIRILRGNDIIARALHGHLLVCFKENINEQLSNPDSTATDDIVYISWEQMRKCGHLPDSLVDSKT